MAEAKKSAKPTGLTRGKMILIGVLSVALVVILYVQFGTGVEKPGSEPAGYRPPHAALATPPANSAAKTVTLASAKMPTGPSGAAGRIIDEKRWKSPELTSVVAYDPFALPASFPQPRVAAGSKTDKAAGLIAAAAADDAKKLADAVEKLHMELEELTQRGVHVIIRESDGYAAVIGDRMLHVGDKINDFTITSIDPDGVHIERKESP